MKKILHLVCTILLFGNNIIFPQMENLESKIDSYLQPYVETGDFSGSILISKSDDILFSKGYGFADISHNIANTPQTKFKLASVSKQFTAAAILILEQDELLKVDNTIDKFISDYPQGEKITLHHLLTHTSGIPDIFSLPNYYKKKNLSVTLEDVVNWIKEQPLEFQPGERYSYSNSGYNLLAYLIEKVSGLSYVEFLSKHIFALLEMKNSGEYQYKKIIRNLATGYDPSGFTGLVHAPHSSDVIHRGSGSLYSTVEDLHKWLKVGLQTNKVLNASSRKKMLANQRNAYGYGISVYKVFGMRVYGHDGRMPGYIADVMHYIENDISIIFLGNIQTGVGDFLRRDLAAIVFDKDYEVRAKTGLAVADFKLEDVKDLLGVYQFAPTFKVSVRLNHGKILARANQGESAEMILLSDGSYMCRVLYAYISFEKNEHGKINKITWVNNDGNSFTGSKVR